MSIVNTLLEQSKNFMINYVRTTLKSKCVSVLGPKLWNKLPKYIADCKSVGVFKKRCKQYLSKKYSANNETFF